MLVTVAGRERVRERRPREKERERGGERVQTGWRRDDDGDESAVMPRERTIECIIKLVSDVITVRVLSSLATTIPLREFSTCKPHFDQLFKRTGSLDKSFEGTPKIVKPEKEEKPQAAKASSMFVGTREKCFGCKNTVYPTEKVQ
ncbi:hypothetical protein K7X08_013790 [Anisodus acutangulus]|uniref:Uncharacterized protein n=1 Tax=Anisodus acutangulus TaxID=402998 RepID=A0A9Q1LM92_9SOLA|nr:hypothetical protein K7X08_013790 [Anisodus acutangulus]